MLEVAELASVPFLSGVPAEELVDWAREAETDSAARRDSLFQPGDPIEHLILLRSGLVVYCLDASVGETRMTTIIDPRRCLNICCLHPQTRHSMSGVALTDCELIRIPAASVRNSVERGGKLARTLAGYAAAWLTELSDEFIRATTQDVRTRAAAVMIKLMDTLSTNDIPLSQEQIAGLIGTRRETLALTLGEMRRQKILDTKYRRIRVLNRQALLNDTRGTYPTCIPNVVPVPITGASAVQGD